MVKSPLSSRSFRFLLLLHRKINPVWSPPLRWQAFSRLAGVMIFLLLLGIARGGANPLNPDDLPQDLLEEPPPSLVLIAPGLPPPVIVIPRQPTEAERFAAQEMATHLEAITSQSLAIFQEGDVPEKTRQIHLGRTTAAVALLPKEEPGPEEYLIVTGPKGVTIVGGSLPPVRSDAGATYLRERGTLYGVYEFLENLGVRWYRPEPWGTHLPKRPTIALPQGTRRSGPPAFKGRSGLTLHPSEDRELAMLWSVRQRLNIQIPEKDSPANRFGDRVRISLGHSHNKIIPPAELLASHPEYFALVNGERGNTGSGRTPQLCLGNPALQEEFARRVIERARANPQIECIEIDPQDGTQLGSRMCTCELCIAMDDPANPLLMSNRIFAFSNIIARRLDAALPGRKVGLYAYSMHTEAPTLVEKLEPNIIVGIANINSWSDHARDLFDSDSKRNARLIGLITQWKNVAPHPLWMREYSSYGWNGPTPGYRLLQRRIAGYRKLGIEGIIWRGEPHRGPQLLLLYLKARLQWNPDLPLEQELDAFYTNYYGPAAVPMKAYHERWMSAFENYRFPAGLPVRDDAAGEGITSGGRGMHLLCNPPLLNELAGYLEQATGVVKEEPLYTRRLAGDLASYALCYRIAEILAAKLKDGVPTPYSSSDDRSYLESAGANAKWTEFETWLDRFIKGDLVFDVWTTPDGVRRAGLGYMKRDILKNFRYRGWDEAALLKAFGFDQPLTSTLILP